ncbi:MAG: MMPL family transporter [Campylobacteraceae bacterium]|jgi:predicted RND superfamily exporter protein|nr:MMPL family transporter [Campylobacteraceae bacterium]
MLLKKLYANYILAYPLQVLVALLLGVLLLGFGVSKLEVDASAETLLLEDDDDLKFMREVSSRYPSGLDMLIISFAPKNDLLSHESLQFIEKISNKLKKLERVDSVTSILEVPLLENNSGGIKELANSIVTLKSPNINLQKARQEFLASPIYSQNLVSKDLKTTAIVVMLKPDNTYFSLLQKRNDAKAKAESKNATKIDKKELAEASKEFKTYRDELRLKEHKLIRDMREILKNNEGSGVLFLGGVNMIAVDMITFIKSDLVYFGTALFLLFIFALWLIFRQLRWIVLPLLICILSIIATTGILGFFGWEVTVISSNFIALQLILTISIVLHLTVRYRELVTKYAQAKQKRLILLTILSKINPSFFAVFTTIIGFLSLMLSKIKPVISFGWMMASGISLSLIIAFVAFPAILMLLPKKALYTKFEKEFAFSSFCAKIVHKKGYLVIAVSAFLLIFAFLGIQKIKVENSFIDYFKPDTQIYQGMKNIDQNLGGTTPLDVIVNFKTEEKIQGDDFDDFEAEFVENKNDPKYWFSPQKTQKAMRIHDYFESLEHVGKVQSLGTMLKVGKRLNDDKDLDNFELALVYTQLPSQYKDTILSPFLNIEHNELRFTMRLIDSDPNLKRDELLKKMQKDLDEIIASDTESYKLSGAMVLYNNMLQSLFKSQIATLGAVVLAFLVIFYPLFGSLKAAAIGIVANLVPMGAVFGFMGYAGIPLDMMTITIAAISIGIGVDDVIHYIHRFKEELGKDGDYVQAMYRSHNSIGYAMYYTTIATVLGFSVLVFSNFIPTIYFGILTVAVMLMVFFGAILLLPKLLIILKPFKV